MGNRRRGREKIEYWKEGERRIVKRRTEQKRKGRREEEYWEEEEGRGDKIRRV
jgi:hypothetical protein